MRRPCEVESIQEDKGSLFPQMTKHTAFQNFNKINMSAIYSNPTKISVQLSVSHSPVTIIEVVAKKKITHMNRLIHK